ncbi:quinone oxidoreductase [uncultured Jatrophihabitans sp.]|uniref:quinone oxidoreductase family protein n=1 Tax=uncultured Jatrophihabitans sp. TaxID=1610747 RepID=UPI0035CA37FB
MPADTDVRALIVPQPGGADVLEVRSVPRPQPGPGQLVVQVQASGVNFKDVYMREGIYPAAMPLPLGDECAGQVLEVGEGVTDFAVGDVVATAKAPAGAHAEVVVLDAAGTVAVPEGVDAEIAAAAMLQGMTAHYLVHATYMVGQDEIVLVHAAAGGVGALLVQMAKAQGAQVIATVGSEAKVAVARDAGADHVLRTDVSEDLAAEVRAIAPDGVDVVYDGVGKDTFEASLRSLHKRGLLALFGASSGQVPPFDLQRLNPLGSLFVTRPTLADYVANPEELRERAGDLFAAIADGTLTIAIGGRYPLAEARRAYDDLEGRRTTGKLLLVP